MQFLEKWGEAAYTTVGFFWMALWAFILGYVISSAIQVFVSREKMQRTMGKSGAKSVGLGTFFGFISSSCSFAALATTRSLFKKGAGFIPSMAYLLASTNLVIELGLVIAVFMSWHFIVGEYIGGIILILSMWLIVKLFYPKNLVEEVRQKFEDEGEEKEEHAEQSWKELIQSKAGWSMVGKKYIGEWRMVWKDITVGFTIAGVIAAFVPPEAYEWLFVGTKAGGGGSGDLSFLQVLQHSVIGPVAAFLTFIGSMGNIPLASLLYENGVSVAGIMAFIFSDLVVFPVLRINAKYYNWRMSLYILMVLFVALVGSSLILHYGFQFFEMVPQGGGGKSASEREFFKLDYSFYLNIGFILVTGLMIWLSRVKKTSMNHQMADKGWVEKLLFWLSVLAYGWLVLGLGIKYFYLG